MANTAKDLTLMLIYLTAWTEEPFGVKRSWKGYQFEILDELANEGLIRDSKRAKSVYLTKEGERQARELLSKYGLVRADVESD